MAVRAPVALHADRAHVAQQHDRALPDLAVQAGAGELLAGDRVRGAQHVEPLPGDLADDPDPQPRPGERLPPDDPVGQAELGADPADLVLEQRAQRLDQRELQVVREPADVVVACPPGR